MRRRHEPSGAHEVPPWHREIPNSRLRALQHKVAGAGFTGVPWEEIDERVIDPSLTSDEEKAALRLYSYSFLSRFELWRIALERLLDFSAKDEEAAGKSGVQRRTASWVRCKTSGK
jgi:hypothetical protein